MTSHPALHRSTSTAIYLHGHADCDCASRESGHGLVRAHAIFPGKRSISPRRSHSTNDYKQCLAGLGVQVISLPAEPDVA